MLIRFQRCRWRIVQQSKAFRFFRGLFVGLIFLYPAFHALAVTLFAGRALLPVVRARSPVFLVVFLLYPAILAIANALVPATLPSVRARSPVDPAQIFGLRHCFLQ